jgi:hypothetical protein
MQAASRYAFKEWASVCAALAQGRQHLLLRKGGIDEGPRGFRVEHDEFWLYPTQFHQTAAQLAPAAADLAALAEHSDPPRGRLHLSLYVVVEHVARVTKLDALAALAPFHVLSEETVRARFHYRTPGLFVLLTRVYAREQPFDLEERPAYAGCRSWVELAEEFPTDGLSPIMNDQRFVDLACRFRASLR